jgi:hypothetical protein
MYSTYFLLKTNLPDYIEIISSLNLLALLGGLAIWFLNRKKEKDKIKYDERKQVKRILFVLLEIRNQIIIPRKIDMFSKIYPEVIKEKALSLGEDVTNFSNESASAFFKPLITKLYSELKMDDDSLLEQFNLCVSSLSEIDPLLSYQINGKQNIKRYLDKWEDSMTEYYKESGEEVSSEELNTLNNHIKPFISDSILKDFDDMVLDIAKLINRRTKKKTKGILKIQTAEEIKNEMKSEIENLFNTLENLGNSKL